MSALQLKQKLSTAGDNGVQVIDVRSKPEWDEGHIDDPRVVHIELSLLPLKLDQISADKEIYVICASGARSAMAQQFLQKHGISAINVVGGMNEYV